MLGKTVLLSFLLLCPFTCPLLLKSCNFDVKITQSLLNEGFHRNITYTIQFNNEDDNEQLYMDCIVGIDQTLPPGVYVNPDELGELKRHNKITAIPKNRVNVELPTEQSSASNVFLIGSVRAGAAQLWLPAHARYHLARSGGGMARNEIGPPQLYLRCPDRRLQACPPPARPAAPAPPAPARAFLCGGAAGEQCSWKLMPYTMLTAPLVWSVPLGDTGRLTLVAAGSLAALLAGSLHILAALHQYKRRGKRA